MRFAPASCVRKRRFAALAAVVGGYALTSPAHAWTRDRVAVVVDNRSSNTAATAELAPVVTQLLTAKGYDVIPQAEVASALQGKNLAPSGDLTNDDANKLREGLGAEAVLLLKVSFFLEPRPRPLGPKAGAAFGLQARVLSASGKVWRNSLGWIADDPAPRMNVFTSSRKAAPTATAMACERLLWSMPRGRPDPNAVPVTVEEIAPPAPPAATRFKAPLTRQRDYPGVSHFPLKIERPK